MAGAPIFLGRGGGRRAAGAGGASVLGSDLAVQSARTVRVAVFFCAVLEFIFQEGKRSSVRRSKIASRLARYDGQDVLDRMSTGTSAHVMGGHFSKACLQR